MSKPNVVSTVIQLTHESKLSLLCSGPLFHLSFLPHLSPVIQDIPMMPSSGPATSYDARKRPLWYVFIYIYIYTCTYTTLLHCLRVT